MTDSLRTVSGVEMSPVGLGLWKVPGERAETLIAEAAECGYRHFDSACDYGNEPAVGRGLQKVIADGICSRDELWVTSKLWNTYHAAEHVRPAAERTLADLQLDYLDLYLIHFPIALRYVPFEHRYPPEWLYDPEAEMPRMEFADVPIRETWEAMEELVTSGLVRHIGICNFSTGLLRDLLTSCKIRPAVLQVELHPYLIQQKLLRYCEAEGISVTGFSPLGAASYFELNMAAAEESLLGCSVIQEVARSANRTPAQVLLRWGIQRGTSVIPKTTQAARLRENLAVFDFELSSEQMQRISALDRHRRFNDPGDFGEAAFNTYCPIYD